MGNFYTNVTVRGPESDAVIAAVKALGYRAFVSETVAELTVVCEERSDTQDTTIWLQVPTRLSQKLNCPALAVLNHDDDILALALCHNGHVLDEYNSCPGYWTSEIPEPPVGGNARVLCEAFGMPGNAAEVERILRTVSDDDDENPDLETEFVFAWERHVALTHALGWPEVPCHEGFQYLKRDGAAAGWRLIS